MAFTSNLHLSTRTGRWQRCVAVHNCQYGAHKSQLDLAKEGGAEIQTHGHSTVQTVSPLVGGVFTVGTGKRKQTFREDGTRLSPKEARVWRNRLKRLMRSVNQAAKRKAKKELRRAVSRAKLRAKWAAQDSAKAVIVGIVRVMEASTEAVQREIDALVAEFDEELELQLAAFEELFNPPA